VFDGNLDLEAVADGVMVRDVVRDGDGVLLALFVLWLVWVALWEAEDDWEGVTDGTLQKRSNNSCCPEHNYEQMELCGFQA
jgi:hypothetical protein